jgi:alkylhydroperoxidase family enzyme
MAWIKQLEQNELTEDLQGIVDEFRINWNRLGNIIKIQSLKPQSLKFHLLFYRSLMFDHTVLTRIQSEMIAVVVSRINACDY